MEKKHIIIDIEKCIGCFNCMLACRDEFVGNRWAPYSESMAKDAKWIDTRRYERGKAPYTELTFVTQTCRHCAKAACEKAFPQAIDRREDGIVLLDMKAAKGNKALVDACPYGMITWNEEMITAQKCTMCAHLLDDGWEVPRCVQACPLRALSLVKCSDEEFAEMTENLKLKPLEEGENRPRVLYRNLYRLNSCFIKGAVVRTENNIVRAQEGVEVKLFLNGELIDYTKTDFFGEFKFDRIPKNSGTFTVTAIKEGFSSVSKEVTVGEESQFMGEFSLE